jgi:pimeloyl-ACP methyl ester carboxylesterase
MPLPSPQSSGWVKFAWSKANCAGPSTTTIKPLPLFSLIHSQPSTWMMSTHPLTRYTSNSRKEKDKWALLVWNISHKKEKKMNRPLPAQLEPLFTHQTAQVNGIRVHYVIGGQGFPVVLLHGWPQTWYEWRKIMPALAEKYTVIVPDSRGMGASERTESGYDAATLAEDAFSLVRSLGFQKAFVVGHDLGVSTAYAYAARYREAVQGLVILDIPLEGFGREELAIKANIWHFGFFQAHGGLAESLVEGREQILLQWFFSLASAAFTQEDIDEYVRWYSGRDALRAGFEYYRSFSTNAQLFQEYSKQKLHIPVLGLGGEYSGTGLPASSLAQLAENVSGGIIPQCGHFIAEEQPEELVRRLKTFFSEHEMGN